ncbi:MAG: TIR domain-containing protein [Candidatus Omnitrophota bacterium]
MSGEQQNQNPAGSVQPNPENETASKDIFVVSSERDEINTDCLNVLKNFGINAIVINFPDQHLSLSEILGLHPRVKFGLIILAGDDFIYDRLTGKPGSAILGAKANAVFHLGYLLGRFGHSGILAVYKEQKNFRFPTGLQNVSFVPYQKGGNWEQVLKSRLQKCGILSGSKAS